VVAIWWLEVALAIGKRWLATAAHRGSKAKGQQ